MKVVLPIEVAYTPSHWMGYTSSLFKMLRNVGAAIGIAVMTISLLNRE